MSAADRFWAKVNQTPDGCWLWTASTVRGGYGAFNAGDGRSVRAHRFAWELTHGAIPEGKVVCHRCDVRLCCNPDHLFLGTQAENLADMVAKGRREWHRGEAAGRSRLTESQVTEIRARAAAGETRAALARELGLDESHVCHIVNRDIWKHVP